MNKGLMIGFVIVFFLVSGVAGCTQNKALVNDITTKIVEKYNSINELKYMAETCKPESYCNCNEIIMKKPDQVRSAWISTKPCTSEEVFGRFDEESKDIFEPILGQEEAVTPKHEPWAQYGDIIRDGNIVYTYEEQRQEIENKTTRPDLLQDIAIVSYAEYQPQYLKAELLYNVGALMINKSVLTLANEEITSSLIEYMNDDENLSINLIGEEKLDNKTTYVLDFILSDYYKKYVQDTDTIKVRVWVDKDTMFVLKSIRSFEGDRMQTTLVKELRINEGILTDNDFEPSAGIPIKVIPSIKISTPYGERLLFCNYYTYECLEGF